MIGGKKSSQGKVAPSKASPNLDSKERLLVKRAVQGDQDNNPALSVSRAKRARINEIPSSDCITGAVRRSSITVEQLQMPASSRLSIDSCLNSQDEPSEVYAASVLKQNKDRKLKGTPVLVSAKSDVPKTQPASLGKFSFLNLAILSYLHVCKLQVFLKMKDYPI